MPALRSLCKPEENILAADVFEFEVFGLVTKALSRSEWINNPLALEAIAKECDGLRSNCTWDVSTACDLDQLKFQARTLKQNIRVSELMVLCDVKHIELHESKHRYKGRIVYRGEVPTQHGDTVLFTEASTSPTTMTELNLCLWWGCVEGQQLRQLTLFRHFCKAICQKKSSRMLCCQDNSGYASGVIASEEKYSHKL